VAGDLATARGRIERPRVAGLVADALETGHLLVVADAGYGKTTALEQGLEQLARASAWVRCVAADRDAAQLLLDLIGAVRAAVPGAADVMGEHVLADGARNSALATRALLVELERLLVEPLALVIDDAEQLTDSTEARAVIQALLTANTQRVAVAVLSRRPLGVKLARSRAHGLLRQLGAADLAFTADECHALLSAAGPREPAREEVEQAMADTEGWPLGIVLSALAGGASGVPGLSSRADVFEFLAEEVLDSLTADERVRVIDSSLPRELSAQIESELGLPEGWLGDVEGRGLFLRAVDPDNGRYRYHPLFREFLLRRFQAERSREDRRAAHLATARGLRAQGLHPESIDHWLEAECWDDALGAILHASDELGRIAPERVESWLGRLPASVRAEPAARFVEGQLAWATARVEAAVAPLREAIEAFEDSGEIRRAWLARSHLADALWFLGEWDDLVALSRNFDSADAEGYGLRIALRASEVQRMRGRFDEEADLLQRIVEHPRFGSVRHYVAARLAERDYEAGRIDAALARLDAELGAVTEPSAMVAVLMTRASLLSELSRDVEAASQYREAEALARAEGDGRAGAEICLHLALLHSDCGNVREAETSLQAAGDLGDTAFSYLATVAAAKIARLNGDRAAAADLAGRALAGIAPASVDDEVTAALQLSPLFEWAGDRDRAMMLVEEKLALTGAALPEQDGAYYRARLLARRAWLHGLDHDQAASDADLAAAWAAAGAALEHVIRPEWTYVRRLVWDALARGSIDVSVTMAAIERAMGDGEALVELTEHPVPEVRVVAVRRAIESGHPGTISRLGTLASDADPTIAAAVAAAAQRLRSDPPPLTFSVLGSFAVRRGHWSIPSEAWQRPVVSRLLRFLVINHAEPLAEDFVFEAFWPDKPAKSARHNLAVLISQIRAVLDLPGCEESVVQISGRTYRLALRPRDRVDSDEFDAAAARALAAPVDERQALLERAASLWSGAPLPEDRYSEWTLLWRERLVDRYVQVLTALTEIYLGAGHYAEVIRAAGRALEHDSLNEALHRALILAYARSGRTAHALRQYLRCRREFVDALGVEPSRETAELQARILAGSAI
jgi:ATP/maltotriose-dependent transcriptional regulator MalT/DNA-binding SARP family transcriptional activator